MMHMSPKGLEFLFRHEAQTGKSNTFHWPGPWSGVTIGPGYDMLHRAKGQIIEDMLAIKLSADEAELVSQAAGRHGAKSGAPHGGGRDAHSKPKTPGSAYQPPVGDSRDAHSKPKTAGAYQPPVGDSRDAHSKPKTPDDPSAQNFAEAHRDEVWLDEAQQKALLRLIIPAYEAMVRRRIHVPVTQPQFDALVSLTYNTPTGAVPVAHAVNAGKLDDAARVMRERKEDANVKRRREDEIWLLQHGLYEHPPAPKHPARRPSKSDGPPQRLH